MASKSSSKAPPSPSTKKTLSRSVMGMKFMQRCQETELRKKLEEEQKKTAKDSHWVLPGISEDSFPTVSLMEESTFDIPLGRRSFNKMNSQIETLEQRLIADKNKSAEDFQTPKNTVKPKVGDEEGVDVTAEQLVNQFSAHKRKRKTLEEEEGEEVKKEFPQREKISDTNFYRRSRKSKKAMNY